MLYDVGLSPMNVGMKPVAVKFPRNKKENHTFLPGIIRKDPSDPVPSVPSRVLNWIIFLSAGDVELKKAVPRKLSKPKAMPEFFPAAAATIRSIFTANPPSGIAPTGFVPRNVLTTDVP